MSVVETFAQPCARIVEFSLQHFLHEQAVFFAERLATEFVDDETLHLLATAHLRAGNADRAYHLLKQKQEAEPPPRLRYLLAMCCVRLEKFEEADAALGADAGAPGLFLLGQVKEKLRNRDQAIECYSKCLELCPFMWCAFERLSLLVGAAAPPAGLFASTYFNESKFSENVVLYPQMDSRSAMPEWEPCSAARKRRRQDTPLKTVAEGDPYIIGSPVVTPRPRGRVPLADRSVGLPAQLPMPAPVPVPAPAPAPSPPQTPMRLLSRLTPRRLHATPQSAASPRSREPAPQLPLVPQVPQGRVGGGVSGAEVPLEEFTFVVLIHIVAQAVHSLHCFACREALEVLRKLPERHYQSSFVQNVVARCYFELADYRRAVEVYAKCDTIRPLGVEYYSTALWHLRECMELGCLAQRVLTDRLWPQAWCVVGNCFSLQGEHDQAIRCFRRAIQLEASFAYAHTLCAHELVAREKFEKAVEMYERAISLDGQHYNAWWGLGNVHLRLEQHQNAKCYFQRAVEINPGNAVLWTSLGMACQSLGEKQRALQLFSTAERCRECGLASFHKGCVLGSLGRSEEAIEELRRAQTLAPREPSVQFQLGRAHAAVGDTRRALLHFTMAMDLCGKDSKEHQIIVAAQEFLSTRVEETTASETPAAKGVHHAEITPMPITPGPATPAPRGRRLL